MSEKPIRVEIVAPVLSVSSGYRGERAAKPVYDENDDLHRHEGDQSQRYIEPASRRDYRQCHDACREDRPYGGVQELHSAQSASVVAVTVGRHDVLQFD